MYALDRRRVIVFDAESGADAPQLPQKPNSRTVSIEVDDDHNKDRTSATHDATPGEHWL